MSVKRFGLAAFAAFALSSVSVEAVTLRYANQGDLKSLDPYTLNETTTLAHHGHVYEGLTSRGKDLKIGPGLADELGNSRRRQEVAFQAAAGRQVPQRRGFHRR